MAVRCPGGTLRGGVGVGVEVESGDGSGFRLVASRLGAPASPALNSKGVFHPGKRPFEFHPVTRMRASTLRFNPCPHTFLEVLGDRLDDLFFFVAILYESLQRLAEVGSADGEADETGNGCGDL